MYHKLLPEATEDLTVSVRNFESQLKFLKKQNYKSFFFRDIEDILQDNKSIILTFDDGYDNNREYLIPLLKKYNFKATIFIPTEKIEQQWYEECKMMSFQEISKLDPSVIEIGLHTHSHQNCTEISLLEFENDVKINKAMLTRHDIEYTNVLAYPYGKYPKKQGRKQDLFFDTLKKLEIKYAVKIGNKVNFFPPKSEFELCRIDVKGSDSIFRFKLKIIFGKLKLF